MPKSREALMSRSYLFIAAEIIFVGLVCVIAAILFRHPLPPVPGAVEVELKLPEEGAKVYLHQQPDGHLAYLISHRNGTLDRIASDELAANLFQSAKIPSTWLAQVLHNPVLLFWLTIGLIGQLLFTGRMVVQYVASHRKGKSVVPPLFWWMSLIGSLMLLAYFLWRRDPIGLLGQAFGSFVYLKNIMWILGESKQPGALATA